MAEQSYSPGNPEREKIRGRDQGLSLFQEHTDFHLLKVTVKGQEWGIHSWGANSVCLKQDEMGEAREGAVEGRREGPGVGDAA